MSRHRLTLAATAFAATIALTAIPMTTAAACTSSDLDYKITNQIGRASCRERVS
jgi:hypothetical protein